MCPACFATMAIAVTGVVSTGTAAAAVRKLFHNKKTAARVSQASDRKEKNK